MTACGIMVRSKSEKIIADRLYAFGIDFRYEAQLTQVMQRLRNRCFERDFEDSIGLITGRDLARLN